MSTDGGQTWSATPNRCIHNYLLGVDSEGRLLTKRAERYGDIVRYNADFTTCESVTTSLDLGGEDHSFDGAAIGPNGQLFINHRQRQLFLSEDFGSNWSRLKKNGIDAPKVTTLLIEESSGYWWAGTEVDGLHRSKDEGITWKLVGFEEDGILTVESGPHAGEYWAVLDFGGLFHTLDFGASWTRQLPEATFALFAKLDYNPTTDILYLTSPWLSDVRYSSDFGATWNNMNAPFTNEADPPI